MRMQIIRRLGKCSPLDSPSSLLQTTKFRGIASPTIVGAIEAQVEAEVFDLPTALADACTKCHCLSSSVLVFP